MNGELAKQLKDAGFPSLRSAPSLEEIIKALGGRNLVISADADGHWAAYSHINATGAIGSTATEATAKLWLAINKVQLEAD